MEEYHPTSNQSPKWMETFRFQDKSGYQRVKIGGKEYYVAVLKKGGTVERANVSQSQLQKVEALADTFFEAHNAQHNIQSGKLIDPSNVEYISSEGIHFKNSGEVQANTKAPLTPEQSAKAAKVVKEDAFEKLKQMPHGNADYWAKALNLPEVVTNKMLELAGQQQFDSIGDLVETTLEDLTLTHPPQNNNQPSKTSIDTADTLYKLMTHYLKEGTSQTNQKTKTLTQSSGSDDLKKSQKLTRSSSGDTLDLNGSGSGNSFLSSPKPTRKEKDVVSPRDPLPTNNNTLWTPDPEDGVFLGEEDGDGSDTPVQSNSLRKAGSWTQTTSTAVTHPTNPKDHTPSLPKVEETTNLGNLSGSGSFEGVPLPAQSKAGKQKQQSTDTLDPLQSNLNASLGLVFIPKDDHNSKVVPLYQEPKPQQSYSTKPLPTQRYQEQSYLDQMQWLLKQAEATKTSHITLADARKKELARNLQLKIANQTTLTPEEQSFVKDVLNQLEIETTTLKNAQEHYCLMLGKISKYED